MSIVIDHPDTLTDYHRLKAIEKGGRQAITTAAMNAMWEAIEAGKGREEAERVFFSFFNNKSHAQAKKQTREDNAIKLYSNNY